MLFVSHNYLTIKTLESINNQPNSRQEMLVKLDILGKTLLIELFSLEHIKKRVENAPTICLFPILRAGLFLYISAREILPDALFSYIHLKREGEGILTVGQYISPSCRHSFLILLDTIAGTGRTIEHAINALRDKGISSGAFIGFVCAKEIAYRISEEYPDWIFLWGSIDHRLQGNGFVTPDIADKDIGDLFCNEESSIDDNKF